MKKEIVEDSKVLCSRPEIGPLYNLNIFSTTHNTCMHALAPFYIYFFTVVLLTVLSIYLVCLCWIFLFITLLHYC